jgi:antitoxin component YwqK of YwqJK toxin-antitoxin module
MKTFFLRYSGLLPVLLLLLMVGCQSSTIKEVVDSYDNGQAKLERIHQNNDGEPVLIKEIHYYENGNKRIEGAINQGKREGVWTFWFEHGSLWREVSYTKGTPDGLTKAYHENGMIFYQGNFLNGEKHGEWSFFDVEGNPVNQIIFENGILKSQTNSIE